jgi:hypothetical protein
LPDGAYECELRMNEESAHSLLIVQVKFLQYSFPHTAGD